MLREIFSQEVAPRPPSLMPPQPHTTLSSQQVITKLCTLVYSLGFTTARSGCSQIVPLILLVCVCVREKWARTTCSKIINGGLSMLGFYDMVVPALKATGLEDVAPPPTLHAPSSITARPSDPTVCPDFQPPLFVPKFITWEVRWPPLLPFNPSHPAASGVLQHGMRSSLWKLVGQSETVGNRGKHAQNKNWNKNIYIFGTNERRRRRNIYNVVGKVWKCCRTDKKTT